MSAAELTTRPVGFGSFAQQRARRRRDELVRLVAGVLADGSGRVDDELEADELVVAALEHELAGEALT